MGKVTAMKKAEEPVKPGKATASPENGVRELTLLKVAQAQPVRIHPKAA